MTTDPNDFPPSQSGNAGFRPYLVLSRETDGLTVYFKFDADYSQRLTEHVTLYRSTGSDEIIGCRIRGISRILEDLPTSCQSISETQGSPWSSGRFAAC